MAKALFARMRNLLNDGMDAVEGLMENETPEIQTVNALAASFAILVMADKEATDQEKEDVSEYLVDMDYVIENNLIREVSQLFIQHVEILEAAQDKDIVEYNVCLGEVLQYLTAIKGNTEAVKMVSDTVNLVTSGGSADKAEIKARDRILKALGLK